jgi:general stress protein 26
MPNPQELKANFWKALKADRTMMIGLDAEGDGHARPMTAQTEGEQSPIWFFTAKNSAMVQKLNQDSRAVATFVSKGHELFASVHGTIRIDNDRATIDRLWNRFIAAWYKGGKDDPNLALLRFDADHAEIWLDGSSPVAGIKMLLGADPKEEYKDHVAQVSLQQ